MRDDDVDPVPFLTSLNRRRVRWLLIGRQALIQYGAPVQTMDIDLWVNPFPRNLEKVLDAAHEAGFEAPASVEEIEAKPLFSIFGGTVKIDVFKVRSFKNLDGETIDFATAFGRRTLAKFAGDSFVPPLPSLRDLKMLKRMRDGERDREDLRFLELMSRKRKTPRKS